MHPCAVKNCPKKRLALGFCSKHYRAFRLYGDPEVRALQQHHGLTLVERYWAYTKKAEGCWEWSGYRDQNGYGRLHLGARPVLAHRVAWEIFRHPLTPDQHVCHRCDNPPCVRPEHLFLGDHADNMADKMKKKRHRYGVSRGEAHGCSKLTAEQVREIRGSVGASERVAERYGISGRQVRDIRTRRAWRHLP